MMAIVNELGFAPSAEFYFTVAGNDFIVFPTGEVAGGEDVFGVVNVTTETYCGGFMLPIDVDVDAGFELWFAHYMSV